MAKLSVIIITSTKLFFPPIKNFSPRACESLRVNVDASEYKEDIDKAFKDILI